MPPANITQEGCGGSSNLRECGDVSILDLRGRFTIRGESELLGSHVKKLIDNGVRKLLLNSADLTQIEASALLSARVSPLGRWVATSICYDRAAKYCRS
jgi:hypothetical protein